MFRTLLLSAAAIVAGTFFALAPGERAAHADTVSVTAIAGCKADLFAPYDGMIDCFTSHPFGVKHVQLVVPTDGPFSIGLHGQSYNCEDIVYFSVPDIGVDNLLQYMETAPCLPNHGIDDFKAPDGGIKPVRGQFQLILM